MECNNNSQAMDQYIQDFKKSEGVRLDKSQISLKPGKRSVAKLCLNSLWGKFDQRENMPKTKIVTDLTCRNANQLRSRRYTAKLFKY